MRTATRRKEQTRRIPKLSPVPGENVRVSRENVEEVRIAEREEKVDDRRMLRILRTLEMVKGG